MQSEFAHGWILLLAATSLSLFFLSFPFFFGGGAAGRAKWGDTTVLWMGGRMGGWIVEEGVPLSGSYSLYVIYFHSAGGH